MPARFTRILSLLLTLLAVTSLSCSALVPGMLEPKSEITVIGQSVDLTGYNMDFNYLQIKNYAEWCEQLPDNSWQKAEAYKFEFENEEALVVTIIKRDSLAVLALLPEDRQSELEGLLGTNSLKYGDMLSFGIEENALSFDALNCGDTIYLSWGKG